MIDEKKTNHEGSSRKKDEAIKEIEAKIKSYLKSNDESKSYKDSHRK